MEKLIIGDCIKEMSKMKDKSVDMIFAENINYNKFVILSK